MEILRPFRRLFRLAGREPRLEDDVASELESHVQMKSEALRRDGLDEAEARREALRQFGALERYREECQAIGRSARRHTTWAAWRSSAFQDLRLSLRALRRAPGFAAAAVTTLAVGIGLNAAMFSLVNTVVRRPLPYSASERLAVVFSRNPGRGIPAFPASLADLRDWRREQRSFVGLAGYTDDALALSGDGPAERVPAVFVTDGFFRVLGVAPALGRVFDSGDFGSGRERVVVLSHGLWTRRLGGDRSVLGGSLVIDGVPFRVIGVMAPGFTFPVERSAVWLPFRHPADVEGQRGARYIQVVGRLVDGVAVGVAEADLARVAAALERDHPATNHGWTVGVRPLLEDLVHDVRRSLLLLLGGVALLLVIACANVANLLLARGLDRRGELGVRMALGAGRGRLVRQLLTDAAVLAALGGLAALPLARAGVALARRFAPQDLPRLSQLQLDLPALGFAALITALVALAAGLLPAARAADPDLTHWLVGVGRGGGTLAARGGRARRGLIAVEAALAVVLLALAGLLGKSLWRLNRVDPGLTPGNTLVFDLSLPEARYPDPDRALAFYQLLQTRLKALPDVRHVGYIFGLPFTGFGFSSSFRVDGRPEPADGSQSGQVRLASAGYFPAQGVPLLRGRGFSPADRRSLPPVVVVSQAAARRFWPGGEALRRRLRFAASPGWDVLEGEVVGVVGDVRSDGLDREPTPLFYVSADQAAVSLVTFVVLTSGDPEALAPAVRPLVAALDPDLPVTGLRTMDAVVAASTAQARFRAWLMALFAALATFLAAVGVHGVVAYVVGQRTREMALRRALGATEGQALGELVRYGMGAVAAGLLAGVTGILLLARVLEPVLFQVRAADPVVLAAGVVLIALAALGASALPAWRASRGDPMAALRAE